MKARVGEGWKRPRAMTATARVRRWPETLSQARRPASTSSRTAQEGMTETPRPCSTMSLMKYVSFDSSARSGLSSTRLKKASIRRATDAFFKRLELSPDLALESNDTYFIKLMVEHGLGVSLLPSWAVREEKAAGRLATLRIAGHQLKRSVAMVALGRFQPSPTRAFLAYILEHRGELQEAARAV